MGDVVQGWPFWAVYLLFFCVAMARSHATYAVGRGLRAGASRSGHRPAPAAGSAPVAGAAPAQTADPAPLADPAPVAPPTSRLARRLDGPGLRRAEALMARYGAPLVTLSFLTVGVQTLLNAAAGGLRMPLLRYVAAAALGSLLWAGLYTSAGFAALDAVRGALPWWWLLVVLGLIGMVALISRALRSRIETRAGTTE